MTSVEIVSTFCQRALWIGWKLFLTADEMFDTALEEAWKADIKRE